MSSLLRTVQQAIYGATIAGACLAALPLYSMASERVADASDDRLTPYIEVSQVPESSDRINVYRLVLFLPEATFAHRGIESRSFFSGINPAGEENILLVVEAAEDYTQDRSGETIRLKTTYYYEGGGLSSSSYVLDGVSDMRFVSIDDYTDSIDTGRFELLPEEKFLLGSSVISQFTFTIKERND